MKGLALNVVWGLIIAVVSLLVFLGLVTGTFKNAALWLYCKVYIKILSFFSGQEMASLPYVCRKMNLQHLETRRIEEKSNILFSRKLLAYIIACWKNAEIKGLYNESHPCYELELSGNVENVSEENVTKILIEEDHCTSIENSDYGCGARNQILWRVEGKVINDQRILLIKYNAEEQAVEVIG